MNCKLTVICTLHNEGILFGPTYISLNNAVKIFEEEYGPVEVLFVLDNPDIVTMDFVDSIIIDKSKIHILNYADIALVRNHSVELAKGEYIAFIDGDDMFSSNWLSCAMDQSLKFDNKNIIWHPEVNWIFDKHNHVWYMTDSDSPLFSPFTLLFANHYDALCFAHRSIYLKNPYQPKPKNSGYGYEDWSWNMSTLMLGYKHKIVNNTIIFKRRRFNSVSTDENLRKCLPNKTIFHDITYLKNFIIGSL